MIELGDKVKDIITGFEGIVVAKTEWLNGCVRCNIQPQKLKDGKMLDTETIDEQQLRIVKKANRKLKERPGGNRPAIKMGMDTPKL